MKIKLRDCKLWHLLWAEALKGNLTSWKFGHLYTGKECWYKLHLDVKNMTTLL